MSKTVSKKLGNKYRSFSKQNKTEGGSNDGSVSYGECPMCENGQGKISKTGKISLCIDCYNGTNGHKKLGGPKKV